MSRVTLPELTILKIECYFENRIPENIMDEIRNLVADYPRVHNWLYTSLSVQMNYSKKNSILSIEKWKAIKKHVLALYSLEKRLVEELE